MRVAILGATGLVGQKVIRLLNIRHAAWEWVPLGSGRAEAVVHDREVKDAETFDFQSVDLVFSCVEDAVAIHYKPRLDASGVWVIDNSAAFRMHDLVPLVVPEINACRIPDQPSWIANPNCSMVQLALPLHALRACGTLESVTLTTFQSVSGAGREAVEALEEQTQHALRGEAVDSGPFQKPMAFNVLPCIGALDERGYCGEEIKLEQETPKVLEQSLTVNATAVRVPVMQGHGQAVTVTFRETVSVSQAIGALQAMPGVRCLEAGVVTPRDCVGEGEVWVARVRQHPTQRKCLNFWSVCDNLLKGAALNAVQIAEIINERSA